MKFEVLISCMNQKDFSIVEKSNLSNINTLVINQCRTDSDELIENEKKRMLNTSTRGLSISRNMAIQHSHADICLIADDDEIFNPSLEEIVLSSYEEYPNADIIIFIMENIPTKLGNTAKRLKKYDLLRVSSWQISFKRSSVNDVVRFDTNLGAGTPNGASEENKFLLDCYKAGLKIYFVPKKIATMVRETSTWFKGYDEKFFFNRGKTTRYILGFPIAALYAVYFLVLKHGIYRKDISIFTAGKALFKGILKKDINEKYETK